MFHLASGKLPFNEPTVAGLSAAIAGDLDRPSPDVRDWAPEEVRATTSTPFAAVIAKGMEKRIGNRYASLDDLASDLHSCLVKRGESMYSVFISYRVFSQKYHATVLYDVLNNTTTPGGHRVIGYLDVKRLVKGEDWEEGFSRGLLNSLVALPLLSAGAIEPMVKLQGSDDDPQDNLAKEFMIMQALMACDDDTVRKLETIFPILIGKPCNENDPHYPCTMNFFSDGSNQSIKQLAQSPSPPLVTAVSHFLRRNRIDLEQEVLQAPVSAIVKDLFALQGAQLWNHGVLKEELIPEDSEIAEKLKKDPSQPPLNLDQLCMLKAEFRALVPSIHEVIDRAYSSSKARRELKDGIAAHRKSLLAQVIARMHSRKLASVFQTWKMSVSSEDKEFLVKLRAIPDGGFQMASSGEIFFMCSSKYLNSLTRFFDIIALVDADQVVINGSYRTYSASFQRTEVQHFTREAKRTALLLRVLARRTSECVFNAFNTWKLGSRISMAITGMPFTSENNAMTYWDPGDISKSILMM